MYTYWISGLCWLTGVVWVIFQYFIRVEDEFGFEGRHWLQKPVLVSHAVVSFAAIWVFGVLWPNHVIKGWTQKARRPTGGTLFALTFWLTATGCALYYVGTDEVRNVVSLSHWVVGALTIAVFLVHLLTRALPFDEGERRAPKRKVKHVEPMNQGDQI